MSRAMLAEHGLSSAGFPGTDPAHLTPPAASALPEGASSMGQSQLSALVIGCPDQEDTFLWIGSVHALNQQDPGFR